MIKLVKENLNEDILVEDSLDDLGNILVQLGKIIENAFSNFDGEWESKPGTYNSVFDGEKNVSNIAYKLNIGGLYFLYRVEIYNSFSKTSKLVKGSKYNNTVSFNFFGNSSKRPDFNSQYAKELLSATEVAERLKPRIENLLEKYSDEVVDNTRK